MANRRHRNLFRECLEAHARGRADAGMAPLTHAEWAEVFNDKRPSIGGKLVRKIAESSISRALSRTAGVARRIGMDRAWIFKVLDVDYGEYLAAWGAGPEADSEGAKRDRASR